MIKVEINKQSANMEARGNALDVVSEVCAVIERLVDSCVLDKNEALIKKVDVQGFIAKLIEVYTDSKLDSMINSLTGGDTTNNN